MKRALSAFGPLALIVVSILLACRLASIVVDPADPIGSFKAGRDGLGDFRDVIYFPLVAVQNGVNPYDCGSDPLPDGSPRYLQRYPVLNLFPLYSPLVFLVYWPFSFFSFYTSAILYVVCNFALAIALAFVIAKTCESDRDETERINWKLICGLTAVILATHAGRSNFLGGENALPLTLASLAAIKWGPERPWIAGAALAFTSMKPTYGLPLGFFMLCRGDWKSVTIGWAASIVIGIGGLLLVFGQSGDIPRIADILWDNQAVLESHPEADARSTSSRIDAAGVLVRLMPGDFAGESVLSSLFLYALTAIVIVGSRWCADIQVRETIQMSAIAVGTVACLYRLPYDALLLWLPIGLAFWAPSRRWNGVSPSCRIIFGVLTVAPMFNILTSHTLVRAFHSIGVKQSLPPVVVDTAWTTACIASGTLLLASLLSLFFMTVRPPRSPVAI